MRQKLAAHSYAAQFGAGASLRRLHGARAGTRSTTVAQWRGGFRPRVEAGARGQAVQHQRARVLGELDRRPPMKDDRGKCAQKGEANRLRNVVEA
jgi:hypothetical protein